MSDDAPDLAALFARVEAWASSYEADVNRFGSDIASQLATRAADLRALIAYARDPAAAYAAELRARDGAMARVVAERDAAYARGVEDSARILLDDIKHLEAEKARNNLTDMGGHGLIVVRNLHRVVRALAPAPETEAG